MAKEPGSGDGTSAKQYLVRGLITVVPIWVTWMVLKFMLELVRRVTHPVMIWSSRRLSDAAPSLAWLFGSPVFETLLSIAIIVLVLYALGRLATLVVGRKAIAAFDRLIDRIPFVKTVYGSVRRLIEVLQHRPKGAQRIVLIDFPTPEMKTVGFVTRTLKDKDTGRELAAVYVPTTPNPTSGYLEVVPLEKVTSTNWTVEEAMTFVMSAGAVAPDDMNYDYSAKPAPEDQAGLQPPQ
jgi:uncharacterized membrane protein